MKARGSDGPKLSVSTQYTTNAATVDIAMQYSKTNANLSKNKMFVKLIISAEAPVVKDAAKIDGPIKIKALSVLSEHCIPALGVA